MSSRPPNRSMNSFFRTQRPFLATPDSSRAPFHHNSLPDSDSSFPLASSETILRSLALENSGSSHSADLSVMPPFSHIPGFPLARETVGDDSGSVLSSSVGPPSASKRSNSMQGDHPNSLRENSNRIQGLGIQGKGLSKEYWMPDKDVKECYDCAVTFTSWRRKHHCRICGAIFCSRCASNLIPGQRFATSGYIRVCNICLAKLEPELDDPTNFTNREDTDDDAQSFSEAASGFNVLGRSQGNRTSITTPARTREASRQTGEQLTSSLIQRTGRSVHRHAAEHHFIRHKSLLRQLTTADKMKSKLHYRRDSSPTLRFSPVTVNSTSPVFVNPKSAPCLKAISSVPFRKGLTDEEQTGLPGIRTSTHTQSVYISGSSSSKLPAGINQDSLDREFDLGSHQSFEGPEVPLPSISRAASLSQAEAQQEPGLVSALPFSELPAASLLSGTDPSLRLAGSFETLPSFFFEHVRFMIHQFLTRENIAKVTLWETELASLLIQLISDPPKPNYDSEDAGDIRKLIKIKRIPGGRVTDCEYIHGVVFTKNVAHKKMKTICTAPKVLAIAMPLEFQRVDGYCKLDVLVSQERQYLRGLVQRLTSLEPDLVLVGGNVSGVAIDYFVEAGVTVLRHVKSTVLNAVARSTQTPLITSLDKLLNLQVGQCDLFRVQNVHHRLIPNHHQKTFIRLEGCDPSFGGTLVIRGGDSVLLTKLKSLMGTMVGIVYSLRLESSFLNDEGAIYSNDPIRDAYMQEIKQVDIRGTLSRFRCAKKHLSDFQSDQLSIKPHSRFSQAESSPSADLLDHLIKPYEVLSPSGSPRVKLTPPFALLKLRQLVHQLASFRQHEKHLAPSHSKKFEPKNERDDEKLPLENEVATSSNQSQTQSQSECNDSISSKSDGAISQLYPLPTTGNYTRDEYFFHLIRQVEEERTAVHFYLSNHCSESFKATDHQKIIVQESVTCSSLGGYTCQGPHLRAFAFYSAGDQTVGQIIQMLVDCRNEICHAKGCNQPKSIHQTHWIHGHSKATIQIQHHDNLNHQPQIHPGFFEEPEDRSLIMMQGYCSFCEGYTRKVPMSDEAWRLSLGKYLQLCFYSPGLVANLVSQTTGSRLACPHDAHFDHIRIFFYQGFRIEFQVSKINVYEAIPPSLVLFTTEKAQAKVREEEYDTLKKKSEAFFNSVRNRILGFNYDIVANENQDASEEAMRDLMKKVDIDANAVKSQLNEIYEECNGTNGVKMNIVRTTLVDKVFEWDKHFASFESRFIASDNKDTRRLASVPLKKIFMDQSSVPGSPERLFPRMSQLPPSHSYKYSYNSQSEVESDHAPKGQSFGTFKKTFPSPALKSMASVLAFALPSSMPGLAVPSEAQVEKQKNDSTQPTDHVVPIPQASQPLTPKEESVLHSNPNGTTNPQQSHVEVLPKTQLELCIPSVVIEGASAPSSTIEVLKESSTEKLNNKGRVGRAHESSDHANAASSVNQPSDDNSDSHRLTLEPSPHRHEHCGSPQFNSSTYADDMSDKDEDSKSDSTVVNVRSTGKNACHGKTSESSRQKPEGSDDGTTSEIDLRNDARRLTLRSRRPKDLVLNLRGGVANLVQKFESPPPTERKATRSNSPAHDCLAKSHRDKDSTHGTVKTSAVFIRPSFRRGKSEVIRSTSNILRGKRPTSGMDKGVAHIDRNQSFESVSARLSAKSPALELNHKPVSRNQRTGPRFAPSAYTHSHRAPVSRSGVHEPNLSTETGRVRIPGSPRGPRVNRDLVNQRRSRPESALPVSSFYLHRRMNMSSQSKVTTIARHFDRLSREAERERMKHVNDHRSRPRPIAYAKSSVQAFSGLTAAVNEDSDSDIDECEAHPAGHDADDEGDVIPELYGSKNSEQETFQTESNLTTDVPLAPEITPAGPHPSPDLDHLASNYLDEPSTSGRDLSPTRITSCSPSFLADSSRLPPTGLCQFSDNEMSSSDTGRHSIIKTLSSLWNYRGAEFLPLDYPQLTTEHQTPDNPVVIREDEPSSIIAYTLASKLYYDTLKGEETTVMVGSEEFMPAEAKRRPHDHDSTWGLVDFRRSGDLDVEEVFKIPINNANSMHFRFDVNPCAVTCKVFFMRQFEALRRTLLCNDIVESLARCHKWDASGGKSGQQFLKTKDERFLIKGISKAELEALTKFAPAYFQYLSSGIKEKRPITLAKMFGIFQVCFNNKQTNRKAKLQVQVIENLWATKPPLQVYDLKGLTRNRTVNVTGRPHEVLLDGNFCEMVRTSPVLVQENSLLRLQAGLHNDTLFLATHNVMDYSLAVGFDEKKQEMYVGIIDYLQTYSWDKRLETLVKELGGSSKEAPTIITPSLYKARFRRAMAKYFSVAPNAWMHKWKPYLSLSEDDNGASLEKDGSKSTEIGVKTEECYVHPFGNR